MKRYHIVETNLGFLCDEKGHFVDQDGRVTKRMVFWSNLHDAEVRAKKYNFFAALMTLFQIKLLASDLHAKMRLVR